MRVAVTGASGFVGGRVVEVLAAGGHVVFAFGKRPAHLLEHPLSADYRSWDISSGPLPEPPAIDAVVHCAAKVADWGNPAEFHSVNVNGTRAVLQTFRGARFVHISSGSVYDPRRGPLPHREDEPLPTRHRDAYSRTKRESEVLVLEASKSAVVLRPHAVYGPKDPTLLPRLLRAYRFRRLLAAGTGKNLMSLTHVDNLAQAVALTLDHPEAAGVYNIADAEVSTLEAVLGDLMEALELRGQPLFIPRPAILALASLASAFHFRGGPLLTRYAVEQMAGNGALDTTRAVQELGYQPMRSRGEAFREVAAMRSG